MLRRDLLGALLLLSTLPASAHHPGDEGVRVGDLQVSHAWAEAPNASQHSMPVWLTIENFGTLPDELRAVNTPIAEKAVIQGLVVEESGSARLREFARLVIEPGQTVTLSPGGLMIVLHGLRLEQLPAAHEHFPLTLVFARAGAVTIDVEVEEPRLRPTS